MIATTRTAGAGQGTDLAWEVRHYLTQRPRQLPSRGLYDTLGSALFDAICELPWYPLTRAERRLIDVQRDEILREAGSPARIIELGPGNGSKLDLLLGTSEHARSVRRIELIDVSPSALGDASRRITEERSVTVVTHQARYEDGLAIAARSPLAGERTLVLFLGSNIGNFDGPAAAAFLETIHRSTGAGDSLLLGVDLVKAERELLLAYDDPLGVTAAFNKNLLVHLNRELGASFALDAFEHRAVWNLGEARVEMHLVSRRAQHVDVAQAGLAFELGAGETIWTESSYKYRGADVDRMLTAAGFDAHAHWVDSEGQFLLALAMRR
ncbi:MAG TPA: L-histidine N(alpha)-methyltransferase [Vicinamibacterales bacterium]|nr:L-histidine N(alpha)-methyltransferase [Vicinamibacterales bacterium]